MAKNAKRKTDGFHNLCILSNPPPHCNSTYLDDKLSVLARVPNPIGHTSDPERDILNVISN